MNQLLKLNQTVRLDNGLSCTTQTFLGGGGQGEVYQAELNGSKMALKWYFPDQATDAQMQALTELIKKGAPNDKFLWPLNLAFSEQNKSFGYIMPLRDKQYKSIVDLMKRRAEPSFQHLLNATIELADSFLQLHAKGLCYRDISFGNVFFDPDNGKVLICDNDNVTTNGQQQKASVLGTPRFMAPEIVLGTAAPSTETDLFSLAVLLFYMLMLHHPLEGKQEAEIKCFDLPAMNKLYGSQPLFIFDPHDNSNAPVSGYQDNALIYWAMYPQFIKDLFIKAFTSGLQDVHGRVRESEWRTNLIKLKDALIYCGSCGAENFYDAEMLKNQGHLNACWSCQKTVQAPPRIRIQHSPNTALMVMLNYDTRLLTYHIKPQTGYDAGAVVAKVVQHPQNPNVWGLKNSSAENWTVSSADGSLKNIQPGQSVTLSTGIKINFGQTEGEIRV